jgi:glycine hydroxymethyltransferase
LAQSDVEQHHFRTAIADADPVMHDILSRERARQTAQLELIASENIVSRAVLQTLGGAITNKTVEGYPGNRYHGGAKVVDEAETLAIERAKELFDCRFANVQPHSGSQSNQAVFVALLNPGDTVLSMALSAGGHLSHGATPHMSGKWFNAISYGVEEETGLLNYPELERLASEYHPKLIIAGGSAYPRIIDVSFIRAVAESVGAVFLVDMAHFAGLVAGEAHPSPFPAAHVASCTTTKTLRGPRGGILLTNSQELAKKLDAAVFPGAQGSVHLNVVAAKAVCLGEALRPDFKQYAKQVVENARALASTLHKRGLGILAGGTDTHLILVDVKSKGLTGDLAEKALEAANITCNKNAIPGDPVSPSEWTGVRLGTSAGTTRGLDAQAFMLVGEIIADLWEYVSEDGMPNHNVVAQARKQVGNLCEKYPAY